MHGGCLQGIKIRHILQPSTVVRPASGQLHPPRKSGTWRRIWHEVGSWVRVDSAVAVISCRLRSAGSSSPVDGPPGCSCARHAGPSTAEQGQGGQPHDGMLSRLHCWPVVWWLLFAGGVASQQGCWHYGNVGEPSPTGVWSLFLLVIVVPHCLAFLEAVRGCPTSFSSADVALYWCSLFEQWFHL
jgi:hypothetical protein